MGQESSKFALRSCKISIAALAFGLTATPAHADEGGISFYLLGSGGPGAGTLPPLEGIFFDNNTYYYHGDANADREFVVGGNLVAGLDAKTIAAFPTVLWVPTTNALGGILGLGVTFPIGRPDVTAQAVLTGPGGGIIDIRRDDEATIFGDPVLTGALSWNVAPNLHASLATMVNVPVGHYRKDRLANLSFNRWIVDVSTALTWQDPQVGWDVSGKVGLTFNGTNDYTDYDSGTDFHLEASIEKKLSKQFGLGFQAYHLKQISGDSGDGARLGSFKGRVTGVGPAMLFNFQLGKLPVSARLRYFEEFGVKNRLDGRSAFFQLSFPLMVKMPAAPPASAAPQ